MKQPRIVTVDQLLADWSRFDVLLDARTPAEFAEDHLPGAVNAPVLSDQQRIDIGTTYKQVSAFEAKKRGAALTARNIAQYIETDCLDKPRDWSPLVYCWRGGNRSGSLAIILAQIGFPVAQLEGGYKAFRARVLQDLETLPAALQFQVLCGPTGSGKSLLLQALDSQGEQVLDLEALAQHRGSVLGPIPEQEQPTQRQFETRLWNTLRHLDTTRPVYVECESKKVGNVRVPDTLMDRIRAGRCIGIQAEMPLRVSLLRRDYPHWQTDLNWLSQRLTALTDALGHTVIETLRDHAHAGRWDELVQTLLLKHYDPSYSKSIDRNFKQHDTAVTVKLAGISESDMQECARRICSALPSGAPV